MSPKYFLLFTWLVTFSLAAHSIDLCAVSKEAIEYHNNHLEYVRDAPHVVEFLAKFPYKYSGIFAKYEVDIDNDGKSDVVYALHSSTTSANADYYFLIKPGTEIDEGAISEESLNAAALRVFPQSWGGCQKESCAFNEFGDIRLKLTKDFSGKSPFIRSRYMNSEIIRYREKTYLFVYSEAASTGVAALLEPNPNGSMTQVCLIDSW